jgi:hypothetical protein
MYDKNVKSPTMNLKQGISYLEREWERKRERQRKKE